MNQRLVAACAALPLALGLVLYASVTRLPYGTFTPGGTLDVLGQDGNGSEIVQVTGHQTYRDSGELRMTTVGVSPAQPQGHQGVGLFELLGTWFDDDDAVYPYDFVHPDDETEQDSQEEGAAQMATSQESAVEVALTELGYDVPEVLKVAKLTPGLPAATVLEVGDRLLSVDGTTIDSDPHMRDDQELRDLIGAAPPGRPIRLTIKRGEHRRTVAVTPTREDGRQVIGVLPGFDYEFPFQVHINISPDIGGPSAGLMFSLAVYDTLTPGSLTGGHEVAGTGEILPNGTVGPIGGIQQKIAGAREAGAELFIVPQANCGDAKGAHHGDMRLMMASSMHQARVSLQRYADDPDADLPTCGDAS